MVEHDGHVGQALAELKDLGAEEEHLVMYSTENNLAESRSWPESAARRMFRGEKNTNWGGGDRVPTLHPLAGDDQARLHRQRIGSDEDMLPTPPAAAGPRKLHRQRGPA